jgi:hypothetical protein
MCIAVFAPYFEPINVLPSSATTPSATPMMLVTQHRKQRSKTVASSTRNTLPNVSWEGVPLASTRNVFSQSSSPSHQSATSTQLTVRTTQHGTDRHHDHFIQVVLPRRPPAVIFNLCKRLL